MVKIMFVPLPEMSEFYSYHSVIMPLQPEEFSVHVKSNSEEQHRCVVVVVNLASRPPEFLGSASSASEGVGSQ